MSQVSRNQPILQFPRRRRAGSWVPACVAAASLFAAVSGVAASGIAADSISDRDPISDRDSVQTVRESLGGFQGYPWYDQDRDALRRLDARPPSDTTARRSKWEYRPVQWSFPDWFFYLLSGTGWLLLALAILFVIYSLLKALGWADFSLARNRLAGAESELRGEVDQVEALPFPLQRPKSDLLAEARRHYESGDYQRAMIYLYSYQLIQLDRHHVIRLTKGKTNRQYLREVRVRRPLWELMCGSMLAFEDVFFGRHPLEQQRFERCWNQLDQFHNQLEGVAP